MAKNKPKILLVEDDRMLIRMYIIKLEKEGFEVDVAYNGTEGLDMLEKNKYDLILLDLMMPTMDGFKMLEIYNKDEKYSKAPIVVLSNLGQKEDIQRAEELGIEKGNYIVKANMTPSEVVQKIKDTIATSK